MFSRIGRALLALLALAAIAPAARAQIYALFLKDEKALRRYAGHTVELRDGTAILGEPKSGISLVNGTIRYQGDKGMNELWVVDTGDPQNVPYKLEGDVKTPGAKGGVVALAGAQIAKIGIVDPLQSLFGLAREHAIRRGRADDAQKRRDAQKQGTPEWSASQARYVAELEQLRSWLGSTCFPEAAKKLGVEIEKQRKTVAKEAREKRLAEALASIKLAATPPRLVELAKTLAPAAAFKVAESRHLRFTYEAALQDEQVKKLLDLGERMIDGFRVEFVDGYLGDDFADQIPEECFIEFWFGPEEPRAHERFLTDWYGLSWGDHKDERVAAMSGRYRRKTAPEYLDYWKIADNKDFEAIVAHELGHVLANLHFNAGRSGDLPSFIEEGTGYWLALSFIGKNGVTCKALQKESYAKPSGPAIERSVMLGESEIFTRLALQGGAALDSLLLKGLTAMQDADLAKSWSFMEYLATAEGKRGQQWLRAVCGIYASGDLAVAHYRAKSEELLDVHGQDVFKAIDERWKARAEQIAKGAAEPGKKK